MARASQVKNYYTFVKGLVTEASPLTFPEEASLDEDNCVLNLDGSRKRRKGLQFQDFKDSAASDETFTENNSVFTTHEWNAANNNSDHNFVVVQWGRYLLFFRQDTDEIVDGYFGRSTTQTEGEVSEAIDLVGARVDDSSITAGDVNTIQTSMASGDGKLFVTGKWIEPIVVTYDEDADGFSFEKIEIRTRDTEGVEYTSGTDYNVQIDSGPTSLSPEHAYNLLNQGWPENRIEQFREERGRYPANSEIYHLGLVVDPAGDGTQEWQSKEVVEIYFGNTLAPRGHFLRNIFDTEQTFTLSDSVVPTSVTYDDEAETLTFTTDSPHNISAGSGNTITFSETAITYDVDEDVRNQNTTSLDGESYTEGVDLTIDDGSTITINRALISTYDGNETLDPAGLIQIETIDNPAGQSTIRRPEAVEFYAGRVWYSGISADYLSGKIFFSRIIENQRNYGQCYQEADPTSGEINDLVDTDGGVISIPEMGKVLNMSVVGASLVVYADNGLWEISGGGEGSFTATNFSVRKMLKTQMRAKNSIISVDGSPIFWTDDGIYTVTQDEISGFLTAKNISVQSVQTLFEEIPLVAHESVQAVYNPLTKTVGWLYTDDDTRTTEGLASPVLNKALFLDFRLEAFYPHSWDITDWCILGGAAVKNSSDRDKKVQFLSMNRDSPDFFIQFTWTTFTDRSFLDWGDKDYLSYLETGHETLEDTIRKKQATYLEAYFKRTEDGYEEDENGNLAFSNPSSCLLTVKWGWSDSKNSGRQNGPHQIYRFRRNYLPSGIDDPYDYGFEVVHTRSKVRGKGKSVRFLFESETGKDFHLLGWSVPYTASGSA